MRVLIPLFLLLLLSGCSATSADYDDAAATQTYQQPVANEPQADDADQPADTATDPQEVPDPADAEPANVDPDDVEEPSFACTQDCSGHEAGFAWARDHDITDESECGGNSQSFIEGCEGFAEQRQEQAEEDQADQSAQTEDPVDNEDQ